MDWNEYFGGYEFSGCAIRRSNIISFFGTQWGDKDALETRPTRFYFYYPDESPKERWAYGEIGHATGIHGAATFKPQERWVFVMDDGEVYVVGQGDDGWEKRITPKKNAYFNNVKTVAGGFAYAVGPARTVYRREAKNKWRVLDQGLPSDGGGQDAGFRDLDGFSESELYACGGAGDLWTWDGVKWSNVTLPTNAVLRRICCGADGLAYILTDQRTVIIGRGSSWRIAEQDNTKEILEQLVWYQDRIYVSTTSALFEIVGGKFRQTRLKVPKQESYARLASGDGVLLVAGSNEACMYNGKQWTTILQAP